MDGFQHPVSWVSRGGGLHCGHCDEIKEGDDEEINARGASCTDSIVEIYRCR